MQLEERGLQTVVCRSFQISSQGFLEHADDIIALREVELTGCFKNETNHLHDSGRNAK
jgi:hypothetical protein